MGENLIGCGGVESGKVDWTKAAATELGLKLISKIPEGEVCNYLGIMDTLGGPAIFRPTDRTRPRRQ